MGVVGELPVSGLAPDTVPFLERLELECYQSLNSDSESTNESLFTLLSHSGLQPLQPCNTKLVCSSPASPTALTAPTTPNPLLPRMLHRSAMQLIFVT
jgi:hypothetical protein